MIREAIVTTLSPEGVPHIAPMGPHVMEDGYLIQPFRPSRTLDHLLARGCGVINLTDDARVFAGCVTGRRRDWPVVVADAVAGVRLAATLAHEEFEVVAVEDDPVRPRLRCRVIHRASHAPFPGLNRAVAAVVEGAVLVSRLGLIDLNRIETEMAHLAVAVDKTAGPAEREAWGWLMETVAEFRERSLA